jgi:hypothetical protein
MRCGIINASAAATFLLLAVLTPRALADEVVMRNGARFEGRVIKETDSEVVFQTAEGTITMRRSLIRRIERKPWTAPEPAGAKTDRSKAATRKSTKGSTRRAATRSAKKPARRASRKSPARSTKRNPG